MSTRIFKKPDFNKKEREAYLVGLDEKILFAEHRYRELEESIATSSQILEQTFIEMRGKKQGEINELEAILVGKRAERANLEKPLNDRITLLNERETRLNEREISLESKEQGLFERERACESKLEGVRDLADELGETRTRLTIREQLIKGREAGITERELNYIKKIEELEARANKIAAELQERDYAISLKELNVQSKEENLIKREKELLDGHIRLNDQRGTLERAWKELGGRTIK